MSGYDAIIVAVIFLFLTGFLTPLIPIFVILGRLTTRTQALERSTSPEYVITYNQEMGRLHRVWISTHRPITTHLRGIAEGTLIWKPFATLETVQEVFGNSVVAVAAGHFQCHRRVAPVARQPVCEAQEGYGDLHECQNRLNRESPVEHELRARS